MLRIGRIDYANCTPIFHALQELYPDVGYRYISGVPARLNKLLAAGEIDVCPSSSIEFARHSEKYLILPDISISSCGPVLSVLLLSTIPIEKLSGETILLSSESATSVNLLKILLELRYNCTCSYRSTSVNLTEALQEAPALLLIGDAALKSTKMAHHMLIYDLGMLWYQWTGLPFVFALWLTSREMVEKNGDSVRRLSQQLLHSKEYALDHLERIADTSPDAIWMGRDQLLEYWKKNISYEMGASQREGLSCFFNLAAEMGLIEHSPKLSFLAIE